MSEEKETTQVAVKNTMKSFLNSETLKNELSKVLPTILPAERFIRTALTAMTKNPKLLECTQESMAVCLLDLAQLGIEADGRKAHLIPYKEKCTLIIDYKGLVHLSYKSGAKSIHADKVCQNDIFEYNKGEIVKHIIDFKSPRGEAYCYYATVTLADGVSKTEVMNLEEINKIKARSSAVKGGRETPWDTDFDEMAKKTVFRRCWKWLPSIEVENIIAKHEEVEYDFEMVQEKPKTVKSNLLD